MEHTPGGGTLKLEVTDFGPVVEANIDLRPLTVFVGPSNTGKSYVSILAYALHRVFSEKRRPFELLGRYRRRSASPPAQIDKSTSQQIISWLQDAREESSAHTIPDVVEPLIRSYIGSYFQEVGPALTTELRRCFGIADFTRLHRLGNRPSEILIKGDGAQNGSAAFEYRFTTSSKGARVSSAVTTLPPVSSTANLPSLFLTPFDFRGAARLDYRSFSNEEISSIASSVVEDVSEQLLTQILGTLTESIYYLPADRTGIMHAHRVVVSALLERAQYGGVRQDARIGVLSGVLGDFLQHLIELDSRSSQLRQPRDDLHTETAARLEEEVLQGAIRNESSRAGYPSFFYRPQAWKEHLPLMNASSMVSELAPVVLFLRHIVQRGNVLIIEEPESHLHPEMQVAFTRLLASAVQSGLRVIVTTHSEWIIETIANLVELSRATEGQTDATHASARALPADQVGVWLFRAKKRPRGSFVEEVILDPDVGTFGVGYDAVAQELHNEWASAASGPA